MGGINKSPPENTLEGNLQEAFNVIKLKEKKIATERAAGASSSQGRIGEQGKKAKEGQIVYSHYKLDANYKH